MPSRPSTQDEQADRNRVSRPIQFAGDARAIHELVPLNRIGDWHADIRKREQRLDIATGFPGSLRGCDPLLVDVILRVAQPWLLPKPMGSRDHFLVIAGGELISALRRILPPESLVPALVLDTKLQSHRILQLAAQHTTAVHCLAACVSGANLKRIWADEPLKREPPTALLQVLK